MGRKIIETVEKLVQPIVERQNLQLVEVEYQKEGGNWFLRIFIDKEDGGIDIEDCGKVSELLSKELDRVDPIPDAYFLEVSSPGAERPLKNEKDIAKAVGKAVFIKTYEAIDNNKTFEGKLVNFSGNMITIEEGKTLKEIPYDKVAKIRLAVVF